LANVGTNGEYYSSSSYVTGNNNAGILNFNSTNVNPLNNGARVWARSVRCVQHLPELLFGKTSSACGRCCRPGKGPKNPGRKSSGPDT